MQAYACVSVSTVVEISFYYPLSSIAAGRKPQVYSSRLGASHRTVEVRSWMTETVIPTYACVRVPGYLLYSVTL